jgi:hypothetical protein
LPHAVFKEYRTSDNLSISESTFVERHSSQTILRGKERRANAPLCGAGYCLLPANSRAARAYPTGCPHNRPEDSPPHPRPKIGGFYHPREHDEDYRFHRRIARNRENSAPLRIMERAGATSSTRKNPRAAES